MRPTNIHTGIEVEVDQDRHHCRCRAAERVELPGIEGRIGDAQDGVRGKSSYLVPSERHLGRGVLLPPLVEGLGSDVVIIENERLIPAEEEFGYR
jgi:hypothetical protein